MTTMREVADQSGVSIATVSRVINNSGYVSPELRERVLETMRVLQYQPSALARSLRLQETHTIGVLIPQIDQPFFSTLADAIENTLFESDYRMLLCSAQEDGAKEAEYATILLRQRVDGLIVVPTGRASSLLNLFQNRDIPIVLVDRDVPELSTSRVLVNNRQGGYDGMSYLLKAGHRQIGVIGAPNYSPSIHDRMAGVRQALHDHGLAMDENMLVMDKLKQYDMGIETANHFFRQASRPTAIFALTDVIAVGVMHAAAQHKLRLPDDLSVVGFDNIPLASFMIPSLTTVAQPIYEIGQTAARMLLDRLQDQTQPAQAVVLPTQLIIRESVLNLNSARPENQQ